ncbi:MAG: DUF5906 domain-containing protein [Pseudomonadota bacterium]|uniref:DUF5906 domain-containing protein n=1 Tax=Thalassovita sp. TaxID=1979401 RepID=UPI002AB0BEE2|nr:DUF5906 domain-containing protein [Thalassovita sp.]MEC8039592.1 DUF5906 domain-containing protein [Pseudomonadota bacterium]
MQTSTYRHAKSGWEICEEFLDIIYGKENVGDVWVTGFEDIQNGANWFGMQGLSRLKARLMTADVVDLYFCTGRLKPNAERRTLSEVVDQPLLYADDIGTKVDPAKWTEMFLKGFPEPTFRIETSPGNETWLWKLEGDTGSVEHNTDLALIRAYMIEHGLTDALHDATRYLRLPWGHNSKPAYRDSKGRSPAVGYVDCSPEKTATLDQIGRVLIGGEDWRKADVPLAAQTSGAMAAAGGGSRPRDADMDDPLVQMAAVIGLDPSQRVKGVVDALCPNMEAHGARPETGFSFIGSDGACFCNHASCAELRTPDFLSMIRRRYEEHVEVLNATGKNDENLPASASMFETRIIFGANDPAKKRALQEEANALASRNERRAQQARETEEEAIARLVARFVYLKTGERFYDTTERQFYSPAGLSRHEAVTPTIKAGSKGMKLAANVLANHPDFQVVTGLAYVPGNEAAVVSAENEAGLKQPHINTWTPSKYASVKGTPELWLKVVYHLIDNDDYRNWFLDWLAWTVQNPSKRTPLIPLIVSGQGSGKDTLLRPYQEVLGTHNCTSITTSQLLGDFNSYLLNHLILLQEARLDSKGDAYLRLKDLTGNATGFVDINEKHQKVQRTRFSGNFIALSNNEDAIKGIDHDDRRFVPYVSGAQRLDAVFTPQDHLKLCDADEIGRVRYYLETRDISNFNPFEQPKDVSGSRRAIVEAGLSSTALAVLEMMSTGAFGKRGLVALDEVMTQLRIDKKMYQNPSLSEVKKGLKAANCFHAKPGNAAQVKVNGQMRRVWITPHAPEEFRNLKSVEAMTGNKLAAAYQKDLEQHKASLLANTS